jgi:hypothetical protein
MGKTVLKYKFFYRELESKTSSETEKHNVWNYKLNRYV